RFRFASRFGIRVLRFEHDGRRMPRQSLRCLDEFRHGLGVQDRRRSEPLAVLDNLELALPVPARDQQDVPGKGRGYEAVQSVPVARNSFMTHTQVVSTFELLGAPPDTAY